MALNKISTLVLSSANNASYSTTKTSPAAVTGGSMAATGVDCRTYYGGELTWKITNSGSSPGVAMTLTFQASHDGSNWYDYYTVAGDTTASSVNSGSLILDRGVMYLRALAYAHTLQPVSVESYLQAVTSL